MDRTCSPAGMPYLLAVSHRTDAGCVRTANEDAVGVYEREEDPPGLLLVVADGMGGGPAGSTASRLALECLAGEFSRGAGRAAGEMLTAGFETANRRILDRAAADLDLMGMGTTATAVLVTGSGVHVAHAGDSRAYLVRREIRRLTDDHITRTSPGKASGSRGSTMLSRCLGITETVEADLSGPQELVPGDVLLLCTDGLHRAVSDAEIEEAVRSGPPAEACDHLVRLARERGGEDNITVLVGRVDRRGTAGG